MLRWGYIFRKYSPMIAKNRLLKYTIAIAIAIQILPTHISHADTIVYGTTGIYPSSITVDAQ